MGIAEEDVAAVRAATDMVALVGEHVALRRVGRRWVGRCPFHAERTPSFSLNAEEGLYHCFGCQASGDAITFVRAVDQLDFVEAVERLADRAGIRLAQQDEEAGARRRRRGRLSEAMEAAVEWYHDRLCSHPEAGRARDYLRSRGYDAETVRAFRLGWAPDEWDALVGALGLPRDVVVEAGLGLVNRRGRLQDVFRGRVVFPIFDPGGRAVALGGRVLPGGGGPGGGSGGGPGGGGGGGGGGPKYLNSKDTPLYAKHRTLYGLNWAKANVVETGEVVVCEGYTDVIALFRAGVPRAVATCGTALAEDHFRVLRNFGRRVVLAYDADSAGQAAAERFYAWERRHELDIFVADLPAGTDPGELGRRDASALAGAVASARPFLAFRVERALAGADLSRAEGRARAAQAALAVVAEHPDPLVRDQYIMAVAGRCRIEPDRLREARPPPQGRGGGPGGGPGSFQEAGGPVPGRPGGRGGSGAALEALRLAIHRPEEVADRLEAVLFEEDVQREAFEALAQAATLQEALASASAEVAGLLGRLAVEDTDADADDVVWLLVKGAGERALASLGAEARAPGASFDELAPLTSGLKLELEALGEPVAARAAADRLLAWLVGWAQEEG